MQLDRYLKISKHCGQIGMPTATKQLDVIHLSEKQATHFSCRIFSFTMLLPSFHPVYLQHSSFKQGLFFKVSILLKKIFHYNQSEKSMRLSRLRHEKVCLWDLRHVNATSSLLSFRVL